MTTLITLCKTAIFSLYLMTGGSINGTVTDTNGAVVEGAHVEILQGQRVTYSATINGNFEFENVPSGTYTLEVCKTGYICSQTQLVLGSGAVQVDIIIEDEVTGV